MSVAGHTVALIHFTGPPAIGGIEDLLTLQAATLTEMGVDVRLVVGNKSENSGIDVRCIPELLPTNDRVVASIRALAGAWPRENHPVVRSVVRSLLNAIEGCTQCWVHNIFTVNLNPFAGEALRMVAASTESIRFVAWCADVSITSRFVAPTQSRPLPVLPVGTDVVAISRDRAQELTEFFSVSSDRIRVIPPPLDVTKWLEMGPEARKFIYDLNLLHASPIVFVPAKALPHKGLQRAVALGMALKQMFPRPSVLVTAAPSPHEPERSLTLLRQLQESIQTNHLEETVTLCSQTYGEPVRRGTVLALMHLSDVLYVPSDEEGYGMPLLEALALRLPIICTDLPAMRESAGPFATYCRRDESAESVARKVKRLALSPANQGLRRVIAAHGAYARELQALLAS